MITSPSKTGNVHGRRTNTRTSIPPLSLVFTATHRLFFDTEWLARDAGCTSTVKHTCVRTVYRTSMPTTYYPLSNTPLTLISDEPGSAEKWKGVSKEPRSTNQTTGLVGRGQSGSPRSNVLPWNTYATLFYHVASISTPLVSRV